MLINVSVLFLQWHFLNVAIKDHSQYKNKERMIIWDSISIVQLCLKIFYHNNLWSKRTLFYCFFILFIFTFMISTMWTMAILIFINNVYHLCIGNMNGKLDFNRIEYNQICRLNKSRSQGTIKRALTFLTSELIATLGPSFLTYMSELI